MDLKDHTVVYGGSFNPPHMGHQMACLYLLEALGAREVWLVPAHKHPFGKELADFQHRVEMCQTLVRPFSEKVRVMTTELEIGGEGHTFDLLEHYKNTHTDHTFAFAVGADVMGEKEKWHRFDDIEAMMPVVVLGRGGFADEGAALGLPELSSSDIRERLGRGDGVEGLVPKRVARYIKKNGLFSAG